MITEPFRRGEPMLSKGPLRVLALVRRDETGADLRDALDGQGQVRLETRVVAALASEGEDLAATAASDVLIAEVATEDAAEMAALRRLVERAGKQGGAVIATARELDPATMRRLLREGVADVLPQPLHKEELREAVEQAACRRGDDPQAPAARGRVLVFSRASGGAGATTLAVNAACLLAQPARRGEDSPRVCLLDLDVQFGTAALLLDLEPKMAVFEMAQAPDRLDAQLFRSSLVEHKSGVRVLTAPSTPIPLDALNPELVSRFLEFARAEFDYVVVDMPLALTSWTDRVFASADLLFLAFQLNVPAVRQLRRLLDVLQEEGLYTLPLKIVLNRHHGSLFGSGVKWRQAEKAFARAIDFSLPDEPAVVLEGANRGQPVFEIKPRSKFSRQLKAAIDASIANLQAKPQAQAA